MKNIVWFSEGTKDQKELLGGKGANLAEMTSIGLPVPAVCLPTIFRKPATYTAVGRRNYSSSSYIGRTNPQVFWRKPAAITGFCSQWGKVFHAGDDGYDSQLGVN